MSGTKLGSKFASGKVSRGSAKQFEEQCSVVPAPLQRLSTRNKRSVNTLGLIQNCKTNKRRGY